LSVIHEADVDGIIWTKEVEDYQRFGVVVTDEAGHMTRIVEKPSTPISKRANIGLYYIRNWELLYRGIDHVLSRPANKGEFYLTDAFQYMIDQGAKIRVIDVAGWYDAGELGTLLDTNRVMLEKGRARKPLALGPGATIVEPVYIEDGVTITDSTVGPNVSLGAGSTITGSTVRDAVIGASTTLADCTITQALIGDHVRLEGVRGRVSIGDHSEVRA
ncbi:MAG: sugar phosphate nucleotidyltransferase, partial [Gemmatimonadaceae bacterium]|nr:sugar phosphate nucleotidyltransferase [Gemmatimonadaceae bacterium]